MGQAEVFKVIKENGGWICADKISQQLKVPGGVVRRALMVMFKNGELLRKQDANKYVYKIK